MLEIIVFSAGVIFLLGFFALKKIGNKENSPKN
jgi:hypothetical protein